MRTWNTALLAAALAASPLVAAGHAAMKSEFGEINGAEFRIDVPADWNGGLVIYCHGYALEPVKYKHDELKGVLAVFTDAGYALAESGYSAGGWAIEEAVQDTEALRRHFIAAHGRPKETYITGHSMGGFLTMMLLEKFPSQFDAGLALCGPLASPEWFMGRGVFDSVAIFNYYFPGILPPPNDIPSDFRGGKEVSDKIQAALDASEENARNLRSMAGEHSNKDFAGVLAFVTYVLKEVEQRAGGNPFDNRNVIYETQGDQNALNDGVKRYAAEPRAAEYLRTWYTPTGKLTRPMLAIHTTYDPLVPVRIPAMYLTLASQAGSQDLFVQQYVKHDGHCSITPEETALGFRELREWRTGGAKPPSGAAR